MFEWVARTINGREAGVLHCKSPEKVTMRRGGLRICGPGLALRPGLRCNAESLPRQVTRSLALTWMEPTYLGSLFPSAGEEVLFQ